MMTCLFKLGCFLVVCPKGFQVVSLISRNLLTDGDGDGDDFQIVGNDCPEGDCAIFGSVPDGQCSQTASCGNDGERPCYLPWILAVNVPIGTFKNETGTSVCQPCPPGVNGIVGLTSTAGNGSVSVDDCIVGKVS